MLSRKAIHTGTVVGVMFEDGVILGVDKRAREGQPLCNKNFKKIQSIAPNIRVAGTAAYMEEVADMVNSKLRLQRQPSHPGWCSHPCRESRVATALNFLKSQADFQTEMLVAGVDVTGPRLHTVFPGGVTDPLFFTAIGCGSHAAISVLESAYRQPLSKEEGISLVREAMFSAIVNDLGSANSIDIVAITKGHEEYLRNQQLPHKHTLRFL